MSFAQIALTPRMAVRLVRWLRANAESGRVRLGLALVANRGRFMALSPDLTSPREFGSHLRIEGKHHLDGLAHGVPVLILTSHIGPGATSSALVMSGYELESTGRPEESERRRRRGHAVGAALTGDWDDTKSAASALHRTVHALRGGTWVSIAFDSGVGASYLFFVELAGQIVGIRPGWFELRRVTDAVVVPAMSWLDGSTRVIEVSAPLPPKLADRTADLEQCRDAITTILSDYVARHRDQCVRLALGTLDPDLAGVASVSEIPTHP